MATLVTIQELIDYHRAKAHKAKAPAVGWGGGAPGGIKKRQKYRFHCDAVERLEQIARGLAAD